MRLPAAEYWTVACFVCGRENPVGMRARVVAGPWGAVVRATLPEGLAGLPGIAHGGAVAALLDEAMWYAVYGQAGFASVTAHLEVRFVRPAAPGRPVAAVARLQHPGGPRPAQEGSLAGGRIGRAVARLVDDAGRVVAAGRGRFCEGPQEDAVHRLLNSRPLPPWELADVVGWPGVEPFLKGGGRGEPGG